MEPYWLDLRDGCAIHAEILAQLGGEHGILSLGALESTLNKPKNLYHYGQNVTLFTLAAAYGYGLIKNHCFLDGNKRVALIVVYTFLAINDIELTASEINAANFFLDLAASQESQEEGMYRLAKWIQINSESFVKAYELW
jgi:death on curing protein